MWDKCEIRNAYVSCSTFILTFNVQRSTFNVHSRLGCCINLQYSIIYYSYLEPGTTYQVVGHRLPIHCMWSSSTLVSSLQLYSSFTLLNLQHQIRRKLWKIHELSVISPQKPQIMKVAIYSHSIAPSIDGVCRRMTGLLKELSEQGHDLMLFTLEDSPQDLPSKLTNWVTVEHMCFSSYPDKKAAKPTISSMFKIWNALEKYKPDVSQYQINDLEKSYAAYRCVRTKLGCASYSWWILERVRDRVFNAGYTRGRVLSYGLDGSSGITQRPSISVLRCGLEGENWLICPWLLRHDIYILFCE